MFGPRNYNEGETIEQFVTTLHTSSEYCACGSLRDSLVRYRIVLGVRDKKMSEKFMLTDLGLDLRKAIE